MKLGIYLIAMILAIGPVMAQLSEIQYGVLEGEWMAKFSVPYSEGVDGLYFKIVEQKIMGFDGCNAFSGPIEKLSSMVRGQRYCELNEEALLLSVDSLIDALKRFNPSDKEIIVDAANKADYKLVFRRR